VLGTVTLKGDTVACGNVVPGALSIYRWKGAIEETAEVVILMLIAVSVADGHQPYLDWLRAET
jgi:uncharacterized protein involved in tolerance to divalent cations